MTSKTACGVKKAVTSTVCLGNKVHVFETVSKVHVILCILLYLLDAMHCVVHCTCLNYVRIIIYHVPLGLLRNRFLKTTPPTSPSGFLVCLIAANTPQTRRPAADTRLQGNR